MPGRFNFIAPGAAMTSEFVKVMQEREARRQEAFLNSIRERQMALQEQQEGRIGAHQTAMLEDLSLGREATRVDKMHEDAMPQDIYSGEAAALMNKHRPGALSEATAPIVTDAQVANAPHGDPTDPTIVPQIQPGVMVHRGGSKYLADQEARDARIAQAQEADATRRYGIDQNNRSDELQARIRAEDRKASSDDAAAGREATRQEGRKGRLADQFDRNPLVRRTQIVAEGYNFVRSLPDDVSKGLTGTDAQAMIYAFAKAMDPDSVVREGEYATVQKYSQDWLSKFGFDVKRVFSPDGFLTAEAVANMKATIGDKYAVTRATYDNYKKEMDTKINSPQGYLIDYENAFPDVPVSRNPQGASAPAQPNETPQQRSQRLIEQYRKK
jgi:hypothetical protein